MAKLKIVDLNNKPNVEAYVNVVKALMEDESAFDAFRKANKAHQIEMLKSATGDKDWLIEQMGPNGIEEITHGNCNLHVKQDQERPGEGKKSTANIVLPETYLDRGTGYLEDYVRAIVETWGDGNSNDQRDKACRLLFGIMLLTRCR